MMWNHTSFILVWLSLIYLNLSLRFYWTNLRKRKVESPPFILWVSNKLWISHFEVKRLRWKNESRRKIITLTDVFHHPIKTLVAKGRRKAGSRQRRKAPTRLRGRQRERERELRGRTRRLMCTSSQNLLNMAAWPEGRSLWCVWV